MVICYCLVCLQPKTIGGRVKTDPLGPQAVLGSAVLASRALVGFGPLEMYPTPVPPVHEPHLTPAPEVGSSGAISQRY